MGKAIVIGGGWAGIAAAIRLVKKGHEVTLIEKTDLLLGLGNVGGIMRNNGRFTAAEENIALGADELFEITDRCAVHKNIDFPGHKHASFYDVLKVEPEVRRLLRECGVELKMMTRIVDVLAENGEYSEAAAFSKGESSQGKQNKGKQGRRILSVKTADGETFKGDVFVEATGSTGPMGNCMRYGNGCSMCVLRCPAFGPRVSLTERAGMKDLMAAGSDGSRGAFSGSCKLEKRSLSKSLQKKLDKEGFAVIPLPFHLINKDKLAKKVCKQYALDEFAENLILIDTGYAKLMTSYFDLDDLRTIKGFEDARFADPYAGGKGNSIRYMSVGRRDEFMRAEGIENLFLAGEKSGFFVGHTEAITTGSLAGYNASRQLEGTNPMKLSGELAVGDILEFSAMVLEDEAALTRRFTFAGGEYFERMKEKGLYGTDSKKIRKKVENLGLLNVYNS